MLNTLFRKKTWLILGVTSLLALGTIYVYQVNDLTRSVYRRDGHRRTLAELQEEIKRSEVVLSKNHSLTRLDNMVKKKGFQSVQRIEYVRALDIQVVAAE